MEINFSKGDLLQGQAITPGWYKGTIIKDEIKVENNRIDNAITLNFEDPTLAEDDRTIVHTFYNAIDKGKGFLVIYMSALLNKPVKELTEGLEKGQMYGFSIGEGKNVGKKIQFKLTNEMFNGRPQNRVETFIPYEMEAPI